MPANALSPLQSLEDLTLSTTSMTWSFVPEIVTESLCRLKNLKRLNLRHFSFELGSSPHQVSFNPRVVFANCTMPSVQILDVSENSVSHFDNGFSVIFPNLRVFNACKNWLPIGMLTGDIRRIFSEIVLFMQLHTIDISEQLSFPDHGRRLTKVDLFDNLEVPQPTQNCSAKHNLLVLIQMGLTTEGGDWKRLAGNLCSTIKVMRMSNLQSGININIHGVRHNQLLDINLPHIQLEYFEASNNPVEMVVDARVYEWIIVPGLAHLIG
jgi:hypothetical protein